MNLLFCVFCFLPELLKIIAAKRGQRTLVATTRLLAWLAGWLAGRLQRAAVGGDQTRA